MSERAEPYLEALVDELLKRAGEQLNALGRAVADLGLSVVAKWKEPTMSSPSIRLTASQMSVLGSTGAVLDVDLYVYE